VTDSLALICLPDTLAAGDQWRVSVDLSDYRAANGWAAALLLRGPSVLDVTGTVNTDGTWLFVAEGTVTVDVLTGAYRAAVRVSKLLEIVTLPASQLTVSPNFATVTADELLSHEEKAIPVLEAAILRRVTADMAAYTITSRSATREQLRDMTALLARYRAIVADRVSRDAGAFFRTHSVQF
jgi:hypothetical protein